MQTHANTVLITGGTAGIGLALARKFLAAGNTVVATGRNAARLAELRAALPGIITEQADMADTAALERVSRTYPEVNILINNAGVQYNYDLADPAWAPSLIEAELRTNLAGPIYLSKLLLPQLLGKSQAAIINVSSGLGLVPKQSAPVYCASKAGLHSFTRALRWQLEPTNVKVFEIIPPPVDTAMTAGRGRDKIAPAALVEEFWRSFERDRYEVRIGKVKLLALLQRWVPALADRIMRPGL